jgi:hypothetical protein
MDTDIIHEFGDQAEWNESFYFNFYDRSKDVCGFMRIGLKPNKNEKSVFCFFMLPDGSICGIKGAAAYNGPELSVSGLTFTKVEPEKRWKLSFGGIMGKMANPPAPLKASFSLDFSAMNDVFDYRACVSGHKEEISKSVASEHLEQFGRVKGVIKIEDKEYHIDGLGERDHSWGVREWTAPKMWIWLTCQFSETEALNVTKLEVEQGVVDAGFIHQNGKSMPLEDAHIDTIFAPEGGPRSFKMTLKDKSGKTHDVEAEIVKQAVLPFEGPDKKSLAIMYETLARYHMDGKVGYGIAEYLIKKY